jgi:hypothetical protein
MIEKNKIMLMNSIIWGLFKNIIIQFIILYTFWFELNIIFN